MRVSGHPYPPNYVGISLIPWVLLGHRVDTVGRRWKSLCKMDTISSEISSACAASCALASRFPCPLES
jgi:hypothetical protein